MSLFLTLSHWVELLVPTSNGNGISRCLCLVHLAAKTFCLPSLSMVSAVGIV